MWLPKYAARASVPLGLGGGRAATAGGGGTAAAACVAFRARCLLPRLTRLGSPSTRALPDAKQNSRASRPGPPASDPCSRATIPCSARTSQGVLCFVLWESAMSRAEIGRSQGVGVNAGGQSCWELPTDSN